jgi:FixJ family two-component response regulator
VVVPDLSGPELARRLESLRPGSRTLFVSGYTVETVRGRERLPTDSAFLEKPFDRLPRLRAVRAPLDQPAPQRATSRSSSSRAAALSDSRRSCAGRIRGAGW